MSQSTSHLSDDTSDRLYTPEELARSPPPSRRAGAHDWSRPDPLRDPLPERRRTPWSARDPVLAGAAARAARRPPAPAHRPVAPRPAARPPGPRRRPPARPAGGPPSGPPPGRPPGPPPVPDRPTAGPDPAAPAEPRRFMTATDFLERRADAAGARPGELGLAWPGAPLERWHDQPEDGSGRACLRAGPRADPEGLRRSGDHRVHQPQGRRGQDHRRAGRGLHLRHRPGRRRGRLGQQRDPRHPRHPGLAQLAHQDHQGAAGRPRQVLRRLAVPDRRPRLLRPLAGRRALRRARLRRERQRHRPDPRRRLQLGPPADDAVLPGDPGRHRQQHARRELAGRGRRRRPAGRHQHGPRGHRLQRAVDARRAAGRRLPEPQVQDRHRAVRPVVDRGHQAGRRPGRRLPAAHPRGLPRALRPGAGRRLGAALQPALARPPGCRGCGPAPGMASAL